MANLICFECSFHTSMKCDCFHYFFYRKKINIKFSKQYMTTFQQWDTDIQKLNEELEISAVGFIIYLIINLV